MGSLDVEPSSSTVQVTGPSDAKPQPGLIPLPPHLLFRRSGNFEQPPSEDVAPPFAGDDSRPHPSTGSSARPKRCDSKELPHSHLYLPAESDSQEPDADFNIARLKERLRATQDEVARRKRLLLENSSAAFGADDELVCLRERLVELEDYQLRLEQHVFALQQQLDAARMFLRRAAARDLVSTPGRVRCPRCPHCTEGRAA